MTEEQGSVLAGNPVESEGTTEATEATTELTAPEWVSDDHREFVDNKGWKTTDDVVKSYRNLESQIGTDKLSLPA